MSGQSDQTYMKVRAIFFRSSKRVMNTYEISNHSYVSRCNWWYLSHNSFGVMPSFSACVSVAVPYSSVPQT